MILAGDIGGTNSRLANFEGVQGRVKPIVEETFPSRGSASLDDIVRTFVSKHHLRIAHACFGIAGPIRHGRSDAINLAWVVDAQRLAQQLGLPTVGLINDLEANAYGAAALAPEDFAVLNEGAPEAEGNAAVIAAGTGLGEAGLYWDGKQHWPFASEGGHASFAPDDALQVELLQYLQQQFAHVSWERVLSGPGLHNVYTFLRDTQRGVDRKSTRLNSSHLVISYAVFCLKKKNKKNYSGLNVLTNLTQYIDQLPDYQPHAQHYCADASQGGPLDLPTTT